MIKRLLARWTTSMLRQWRIYCKNWHPCAFKKVTWHNWHAYTNHSLTESDQLDSLGYPTGLRSGKLSFVSAFCTGLGSRQRSTEVFALRYSLEIGLQRINRTSSTFWSTSFSRYNASKLIVNVWGKIVICKDWHVTFTCRYKTSSLW